ncbi:MAG: 8-amino-7-oxononanoate synthase [Phycisphaerae bacterium]|nr:8-amino-7-oxononanoate synthase [Phycisphaerae bacterium]
MKPSAIPQNWSDRLADLELQGLRRSLRILESAQGPYVTVSGRSLMNLSSNDYLGLAAHPHLIRAVKQAVECWGWGAGGSRLVSGTMGIHADLEARLASFKGTEAALVCSTGYQANLAAIRSLAGRGDVIFLDKLNHASIIDAAFARGHAGFESPAVRVFPHRDYSRLAQLLERTRSVGRRIIVTDSVFSMEGDFSDLSAIVELKKRHDALLIVDEAHATGIWGERGRGLAEAMGIAADVDVTVGTLSKALGGLGGFITASRAIIDWLVNTARPFIYTTALPPAACAAAMAALDIIDREPDRRLRLVELAAWFRDEVTGRLGLDIAGSCSQIVPVVVGPADRAVELSRNLEEAGFLVPAIRPPTVPRGKSRLRISLCSEHRRTDLVRLIEVLGRIWRSE